MVTMMTSRMVIAVDDSDVRRRETRLEDKAEDSIKRKAEESLRELITYQERTTSKCIVECEILDKLSREL